MADLRFTDTHCHVHDRATYDFALRRHLSDSKKFRRQNTAAQTAEFECRRAFYEPAQLATRAAAAGVHRLICIGTDPADSLAAANFAAASTTSAASAEIFWTYGVHPDEIAHAARDHAADIQALPAASRARLVAIGEVGLDYHESSDPATRAAQIHLFESMLDLATSLNLPLIFHIRAAFDVFFAVLANFSTFPPQFAASSTPFPIRPPTSPAASTTTFISASTASLPSPMFLCHPLSAFCLRPTPPSSPLLRIAALSMNRLSFLTLPPTWLPVCKLHSLISPSPPSRTPPNFFICNNLT